MKNQVDLAIWRMCDVVYHLEKAITFPFTIYFGLLNTLAFTFCCYLLL